MIPPRLVSLPLLPTKPKAASRELENISSSDACNWAVEVQNSPTVVFSNSASGNKWALKFYEKVSQLGFVFLVQKTMGNSAPDTFSLFPLYHAPGSLLPDLVVCTQKRGDYDSLS